MIASALLRTETERWGEEHTISHPAGSYRRASYRFQIDKISLDPCTIGPTLVSISPVKRSFSTIRNPINHYSSVHCLPILLSATAYRCLYYCDVFILLRTIILSLGSGELPACHYVIRHLSPLYLRAMHSPKSMTSPDEHLQYNGHFRDNSCRFQHPLTPFLTTLAPP